MAGTLWKTEEINLLKELVPLGKHGFAELTSFFPGRTKDSLQLKSRDLGLENPFIYRLYDFNQSFFQTPNYRNCYWAGWIAADGSFSFRGKNNEHCDFRWVMSSEDEEFLNLLKEDLDFSGHITQFIKRDSEMVKGGGRHSLLRISAFRQAYADIEKNFNLTPNKTYRLPPPNLENIELILAYIVGYINGDGCMHFAPSTENLVIKFTSSSAKILEWIKNIVDNLDLPCRRKKTININRVNYANCYELNINGLRAIYFFELLKKVPVPILKRKWENPIVLDGIAKIKQQNPEWFSESIESVMQRNNIDFSRSF